MSQKLCLKWSDFQYNTNSAFGSLRQDTELSDVTLVCEDGQQMEAHKIILTASSPFFQKLLTKNKHPHPLIFMRAVRPEDMASILDFLYYGEVNIYKEDLNSFLELAGEINLKGLTQNDFVEQISDTSYPPINKNKSNTKTNQSKDKSLLEKFTELDKVENMLTDQKTKIESLPQSNTGVVKNNLVLKTKLPISEETKANEKYLFSGDIKELEEMVKTMMTKSQNKRQDGNASAHMCTVCGKEGYLAHIKDHIESHHIEGVSIPCQYCEKMFRSRKRLMQHIRNTCINSDKKSPINV